MPLSREMLARVQPGLLLVLAQPTPVPGSERARLGEHYPRPGSADSAGRRSRPVRLAPFGARCSGNNGVLGLGFAVNDYKLHLRGTQSAFAHQAATSVIHSAESVNWFTS
jgi:hypothetical protein